MLFVGSGDGALYALHTQNGTLAWKARGGGAVFSSPTLSHDEASIYFGSADGNLYAVRAKDGALLWTTRVGTVSQAARGAGGRGARWCQRGSGG